MLMGTLMPHSEVDKSKRCVQTSARQEDDSTVAVAQILSEGMSVYMIE